MKTEARNYFIGKKKEILAELRKPENEFLHIRGKLFDYTYFPSEEKEKDCFCAQGFIALAAGFKFDEESRFSKCLSLKDSDVPRSIRVIRRTSSTNFTRDEMPGVTIEALLDIKKDEDYKEGDPRLVRNRLQFFFEKYYFARKDSAEEVLYRDALKDIVMSRIVRRYGAVKLKGLLQFVLSDFNEFKYSDHPDDKNEPYLVLERYLAKELLISQINDNVIGLELYQIADMIERSWPDVPEEIEAESNEEAYNK